MFVSLSIVRYPRYFVPFALLSMAIFRLPLLFTSGLTFWKLMGCGKNGTFDIKPDWMQWGLLAVWAQEEDFDNFQQKSFIQKWWNAFAHEQWTILCIPYEAHGKWDGKQPFIPNHAYKNYHGPVAVLTRASIRVSKLKSFWSNVPGVAQNLAEAEGFITSVGIGEVPFVRQATFSVWENLDAVKQFAYRKQKHASIIKKTRSEEWYSEELFARFIPIRSQGTLNGKEPFILHHVTA